MIINFNFELINVMYLKKSLNRVVNIGNKKRFSYGFKSFCENADPVLMHLIENRNDFFKIK